MTDTDETAGQRVRRIREALGLTRAALAASAGQAVQTIESLENDIVRAPQYTTAWRIWRALRRAGYRGGYLSVFPVPEGRAPAARRRRA